MFRFRSLAHRLGFGPGLCVRAVAGAFVACTLMSAGVARADESSGTRNATLEQSKDIAHVAVSTAFGAYAESRWAKEAEPAWASIARGTAYGVVPGILKEVVDVQVGHEHRASVIRDLKQDLGGAFIGAVLSNVVRTQWGWSLSGRKEGHHYEVLLGIPFN